MNVAVRFQSRSGHTRSVAIAIAGAVGADALPVDVPLTGHVDLLFLGGAVYAWHLARPMREFIQGLDPKNIGAVAVFSTAASPNGASRLIEKACRRQGLNVLPEEYHCTGSAAATPEAAKNAAAFAERVLRAQQS